MFYISHRGNTQGPEPNNENKPTYILQAIRKGYQCEIDIWYVHNQLYLGHDKPETPISDNFLIENACVLWVHCKNLQAISYLKTLPYSFNYFFHDKDEYTITSRGYIWGNINSKLNSDVICVMPEKYLKSKLDLNSIRGICSDFIQQYSNHIT